METYGMNEEQLRKELERIRTCNIRFIKKVATMRDMQKTYFRTRDKNLLLQCQNVEGQVDAYIDRCFEALDRIDRIDKYENK